MQIRQCAESFVTLLRALYRGMEQLVAREDHSLEVSGSSPLPATQDNIEIININLLSTKNYG